MQAIGGSTLIGTEQADSPNAAMSPFGVSRGFGESARLLGEGRRDCDQTRIYNYDIGCQDGCGMMSSRKVEEE
jgi:hypothetical protein